VPCESRLIKSVLASHGKTSVIGEPPVRDLPQTPSLNLPPSKIAWMSTSHEASVYIPGWPLRQQLQQPERAFQRRGTPSPPAERALGST